MTVQILYFCWIFLMCDNERPLTTTLFRAKQTFDYPPGPLSFKKEPFMLHIAGAIGQYLCTLSNQNKSFFVRMNITKAQDWPRGLLISFIAYHINQFLCDIFKVSTPTRDCIVTAAVKSSRVVHSIIMNTRTQMFQVELSTTHKHFQSSICAYWIPQ